MKCPHCSVGVSFEFGKIVWEEEDVEKPDMGYGIFYDHCPECADLVVLFKRGSYKEKKSDYYTDSYLEDILFEEIIYPKFVNRKVETEVPERYRKDFLEACAVLPISAKASAALSRRILQDILREHFKIKHSSLATEIEQFIALKDVPSYLSQAVDAIRNIGNFAAHPLKDTNTGEIVEVESGEAEWLLDVLESLFDFAFIQPNRLAERKKSLNEKLKSLGKPTMKG
ncbi:DUF4145 domain-containing protein [Pseudanabaena minima]|uniref:DUF4145 domain-containing protein n=1 Tax=Pseudanabaena minima TaxID=890415 RepID=UPI003DA911D0